VQEREIARLQTLVEDAKRIQQTQRDNSAERVRVSDDAVARIRDKFEQVAKQLPEAFAISSRLDVSQGGDVATLKWHATAPARALVLVRDENHHEIRIAYYRAATDEESEWHVIDPSDEGGITTAIEALADQACWQSGGWPALPGILREAPAV